MDIIKTEQVNINDICVGDTVINRGLEKTVCKNNIGKTDFMGKTLWGDNYMGGTKLVTRILFMRFYKGEPIGFVKNP